MSVRPYRDIIRRKSRQIRVGNVLVGGDAPISVQTMTNTLTPDVEATLAQIRTAADAGCDIVRVSCPDEESTAALGAIVFRHFHDYFIHLFLSLNALPNVLGHRGEHVLADRFHQDIVESCGS